MGSGKTTIGTLLARQLAWRFVDLDDRIEASAGIRCFSAVQLIALD